MEAPFRFNFSRFDKLDVLTSYKREYRSKDIQDGLRVAHVFRVFPSVARSSL
jgi:hypothetical protein